MRHWLLFLFLLAVPARAQENSGSISGTVRDAASAVVPDAVVTATAVATGQTYKTQAGVHGTFLLPVLPIGAYELRVEAPGFRAYRRSGIELHLSDRLALDIPLEVGVVSEEINVVATAPAIQTESHEVSGLISGEQVQDLSLNGRGFMGLVELLPGVSSDLPDRIDQNTNPTLQVNGGRATANNWMIDGADNVDFGNNNAVNNFTSVETIAEFRVMMNSYTAEYGRGGGAQVNVVTKGGGRNYHGSVWEFLRNERLNATSFFTHTKLPLKENDFGGTFSGPVPFLNRKDPKTFFFVSVNEDFKSLANTDVLGIVPSVLERAGDFSASATKPRDPSNGNQPFPNAQIPAARMDPIARTLIGKIYPLPTAGFTGAGGQNYFSTQPGQQDWREIMARIDHNFTPNVRVYGRFLQDWAEITNPYGGTLITSRSRVFPNQDKTLAHRPGQNAIGNLQVTFSPRRIGEFGYTFSTRNIIGNASQFLSQDDLGVKIPTVFGRAWPGNPLPTISISSLSAVGVSAPTYVVDFAHHFSGAITEIRGNHVFKYGGTAGYYGKDESSGGTLYGSFGFTTAKTGVALGDFLLGQANTYTEQDKDVLANIRFPELAFFAQDEWKVRPNLTLNAGLRWERFRSPIDVNDLLTTFVPGLFNPAKAPQLTSAGILVAGTGDPLNGIIVANKTSPYGRRITQNDNNTFGPRFGFVWDPFKKGRTVIRSGGGIYQNRWLMGMFENNEFGNPPFLSNVTINTTLLSNPSAGTAAPLNPPNLTSTGLPLKMPTVYQYSFGIQNDLRRFGALAVNYVGSRGVRLLRAVNINQPLPGDMTARKLSLNQVRPYAGYGSINERQTSAGSRYDSLQVTYAVRPSKGGFFNLAYTYSTALTDSSDDRAVANGPQDIHDYRAEWGRASFDRPHIFVANYSYELPFGRRLHGVAGAFGKGWQMSGITKFQTGPALTVTDGNDRALVGAGSPQRPNVVGTPTPFKTVEKWFDVGAFARAASGTFGNAGNGIIRGPGINSWTLSAFKRFRVTERASWQFRSEFFNAFNHPSFSGVGVAISTPASFGVVSGTRDARVIQMALKLSY